MLQIIQYQKSGEITVEDLPDLKCEPGRILVQNYYSLISAGTERTSVETAQASMIGKAKSRPDLVKQVFDNIKKEGLASTYEKVKNRLDNYKEMGYSSAGIVIESGVENFKPGDRVACAGAGYASHSELVLVPKNLAVKIPDNVPVSQAAFTTLGAIALQGIRQADPKLGDNVAVIGLGLLGLITVQLLKANGCRIIGLDINEKNFTLAKECGCDEVILFDSNAEKVVESFTDGYGTDAIIITASTKSNEPIEKSISFARKKSRIVIVGVTGMDLPRKGFYEKELDITISCSYGPGRYDSNYEEKGNDYPIGFVRWTENRNMEAILQLLSQGKIDFSKLITHKIPVKDGLKAYDLITGKLNENFLGILIEYDKEIKKEFSRKRVLQHASGIDKISIGFIGAGNFAQSYLIPNLKGNCSLEAVATRKPVNARAAAQKFSFNSFASDPYEIINNKNINTVFIATHHSSHAGFAAAALQKGKNVFVEKPLAINELELEQVKDAYLHSNEDSRNTHLMVGFNRRFSKPFLAIKDFFASSKEPFIINYRVNAGYITPESWVQDASEGGRIIGEGCHFIDIFSFITGARPVSVSASSIMSANTLVKNEDNTIAAIRYSDGSVANLIYAANGDKSLPKEYCEVFSGGLSAVMDDFKLVNLHKNNKKTQLKFNGSKGHKEEVEHFINVLENKTPASLAFEDIYLTTLVTFKINESLVNNRVVTL